MSVGLLLITALLAATCALWIRRSAKGCRWEGAPTVIVISAALSVYLTSPHATKWVGGALHTLTSRWNVEDQLGHMFAGICGCTAIYMCLIRLADLPTVQAYYTQWVYRPMVVVISGMQLAFWKSHAGEVSIQRFEDLEPNLWLLLYWVLLCGTGVYLMAMASKIVWHLRSISRPSLVLHLYLATFVTTALFSILIFWHVATGYDIKKVAWAVGYFGTILWAVTPAYSWWIRTRPSHIPDSMPMASSSTD